MSDDQELHDHVNSQIEDLKQLLAGRKVAKALRVFLDDPPVTVKNQKLKDSASEAFCEIFRAIKDSEIDQYLSELSATDADILLQYVFKGFESGDNSHSLLKWHAAIVEKWGQGTIVRAMSARRTAT